MWVTSDRAYLPARIQFIFHSSVSVLWYDAPPASNSWKEMEYLFLGVCKNTFSFAYICIYIYVVLHRQHRVTVVHTCKACHIGIGDIQHQEYPVVSINIFGFHNFTFFIQFNVISNAREKLICHLHGLLKDNKSFS